MKCGAGQHKLKVYATNGRYIIRNGIIPILKIHVALPVFMKCGAGQHKLKVYATNGRYIIRNGITFKEKRRNELREDKRVFS